jgi:hypothetical protein
MERIVRRTDCDKNFFWTLPNRALAHGVSDVESSDDGNATLPPSRQLLSAHWALPRLDERQRACLG